jgi:multidrug efflux pump
VISAFNSLTLSRRSGAVLLKDHSAPKDWFARTMEKSLGWFFHPFNRIFAGRATNIPRRSPQCFAKAPWPGCLWRTGTSHGWSFSKVPTGFVPPQDKQYLVAFAQLPDGASLDRTKPLSGGCPKLVEAARRAGRGGLSRIEHQRIQRGTPTPALFFFGLKPFEERKTPNLSGPGIAGALNQQFASIQDAFVLAVPPPPVMGLGTIGDSSSSSKTAPTSATTRYTRPCRGSSAKVIRRPVWAASSRRSP